MSDDRWFAATDAVDKVKESARVDKRVEELLEKYEDVLEDDEDLSIDNWAEVSLDLTDSKNEILDGNCAKVVRFVKNNKSAVKVTWEGELELLWSSEQKALEKLDKIEKKLGKLSGGRTREAPAPVKEVPAKEVPAKEVPPDSLSGLILAKMGELPKGASLYEAAKIIKEAVPEIEELEGCLRKRFGLDLPAMKKGTWGTFFRYHREPRFVLLELKWDLGRLRILFSIEGLLTSDFEIDKNLETDSTTIAGLRSELRGAISLLEAAHEEKLDIIAILEKNGIKVEGGKIRKGDYLAALEVIRKI